ncbi:hypothetical protein ISCGN_024586 [Ixodes scapularis]
MLMDSFVLFQEEEKVPKPVAVQFSVSPQLSQRSDRGSSLRTEAHIAVCCSIAVLVCGGVAVASLLGFDVYRSYVGKNAWIATETGDHGSATMNGSRQSIAQRPTTRPIFVPYGNSSDYYDVETTGTTKKIANISS